MLLTDDRLAGKYVDEPWLVVSVLQNLQTYEMWAVLAHHLFRLLAYCDAGGALPQSDEVYTLELEDEDGQMKRQVAKRLMVKLKRRLATRQRQIVFEPVQEATEKIRNNLTIFARLITRGGVIANHGFEVFSELACLMFYWALVNGADVRRGSECDNEVNT
ncbi:hypothetical protein SARC_00833 [Sphaeroforma arctica JP610]|uniref:Uncharacterized protein n=1 Tax=Sphaeroforma arctica JP610 TaxID=667725 RepID=A0A0L0GFG5_9EUKA|nr:hypothetical protein SARC_00833 [Sphaeroforma arctica JP610]KNC87023.1 hypothetical protein SARC_00833 [Sphaeroforma arctica JP610]|eukprot:XP_014160925.1 hypothetical protein SARC_00833 [Sphaeroforma arctica JP610]